MARSLLDVSQDEFLERADWRAAGLARLGDETIPRRGAHGGGFADRPEHFLRGHVNSSPCLMAGGAASGAVKVNGASATLGAAAISSADSPVRVSRVRVAGLHARRHA